MNRLNLIAAVCFLACAVGSCARRSVRGALSAKGATFVGVVRYVDDGDGLYVGRAGRPNRGIEVRLADFYAPELHDAGGCEAKRRLERLVEAKPLVCRAGRRSYDPVVVAWTLCGLSLGTLLREAGGIEGGRAWRP